MSSQSYIALKPYGVDKPYSFERYQELVRLLEGYSSRLDLAQRNDSAATDFLYDLSQRDRKDLLKLYAMIREYFNNAVGEKVAEVAENPGPLSERLRSAWWLSDDGAWYLAGNLALYWPTTYYELRRNPQFDPTPYEEENYFSIANPEY